MRIARSITPHWYMYPPKECYSADINGYDNNEALDQVGQKVNLYVHIPFCAMKCRFCTLVATVETSSESIDKYLALLQRELQILDVRLRRNGRSVEHLYVGGGTPSIMKPWQISRLTGLLGSVFDISRTSSRTFEASPDTVTIDGCFAWKDAGFDRVSVGVQSFNDLTLKEMSRRHSGQDAKRAIRVLSDLGFQSINVDLIYGLPNQSMEDWSVDVVEAMASGATDITAHPLAVRKASAFGRSLREGKLTIPSLSCHPEYLRSARGMLKAQGWRSIGAVTFSRHGTGDRFASAEATLYPTIGLGAGARSTLPALHVSSVDYLQPTGVAATVEAYARALQAERLPWYSHVSIDYEENFRRKVILGLMTNKIDLPQLLREGKDSCESVLRKIRELIDAALVEEVEGVLRLSDAGVANAAEVGWSLASRAIQERLIEGPRQ